MMIFKEFNWLNESRYEEIDGGIQIYAPKDSDYFVNPVSGEVTATAPFLYQEITGDFVLRAKVKHDFSSIYDACVLLALDHEKL